MGAEARHPATGRANHDLDIDTQELLEELLRDYAGTVFLVSHDRMFLDNVITQSIVFEGEGRLKEYSGGYQDYADAKAREEKVQASSPDYLAQRGSPKNIDDLQQHRLIGTKLSAAHGLEMQWEFKDKKERMTFTPKSQFSINNHLRLQAVSDGLGIAWVPYLNVADAVQSGRLVELLPEYAMTYDPLYLYYPSRCGHSNVFKLIMDALKVKAA